MLIAILVTSILFELLLINRLFWKFRYPIVLLTSALHVLTATVILFHFATVIGFVALYIVIFRLIANIRIVFDRLHGEHLYRVTKRTVLWLAFFQVITLSGLYFESQVILPMTLDMLAAVQFSASLLFLAFIINSIRQTKYHKHNEFLSDKELPAITVAVPARNETADLEACLESILSSNYPKLEIIVLDDCSQDKTPDVIKQYAHAGVRFIQGKPADEGWLAKNYAYEQLTREASGSYIAFCGVDVRMSPNFLRDLITHMKVKKKRMMSVLPVRLGGDVRSSFIQPMRYWWELALPRKLLNKPAVLSTCWVIQTKVLKKLGGFSAVKRSILPERFFARDAVAHDTYTFIRADEALDIRTTKKPSQQLSTAVRVRYPQFRNRIETTMIYTLGLLVLFCLPYVLFTASLFTLMPVVQVLSVLTILVLTLSHVMIVTISNPVNSVAALVNLPFVIINEIYVAIYSMLKYEFGSVIWKGRNICIPVTKQ